MRTGQRFWLHWMIAFIGFPFGGLIATTLIGAVDNPLDGLLGGLIAGAVIGLAQLLALRSHAAIGWQWVIATTLGLAAGVGLGTALIGTATTLEAIVLRAPFAGLAVGLAQWFVLRSFGRVFTVWPLITAIIYAASWFVTTQVIGRSVDQGFVIFGASGALLHQLLTGLALVLLSRSSAKE